MIRFTDLFIHGIRINHSKWSTLWVRQFSYSAICVFSLFILSICIPTNQANTQPLLKEEFKEYRAKAFFLRKLFYFIEWPEENKDKNDETFIIAVLGENPFSLEDENKKNIRVKGRQIIFKHFDELKDLTPCHILFIDNSEEMNWDKIYEYTKDWKTLTVADFDEFAKKKGMIHLLAQEKKIHFKINLSAVKRAKLKVSAQFIKLAETVYTDQTQEN